MSTLHLLAQTSTNNGVGLAFGGFALILLMIGLLASVFWIWMLIDCLTSSLPSTEKLIWVLVIFFLHILGALIYFFVARGDRKLAT